MKWIVSGVREHRQYIDFRRYLKGIYFAFCNSRCSERRKDVCNSVRASVNRGLVSQWRNRDAAIKNDEDQN